MSYSSHYEREQQAIREAVEEADAYRPALSDILARSHDPYGVLPKGVQRDMRALLAMVAERDVAVERLRGALFAITKAEDLDKAVMVARAALAPEMKGAKGDVRA